MPTPLFQVDAFADGPFTGNPAAVCLLEGPAEDDWMQSVAAEMNLSETAYLYPEGDGYSLRWFTPATEVELCGHATLASAHVLFETDRLAPGTPAHFDTASGRLTVHALADSHYQMDFPATPPGDTALPGGVGQALGAEPVWSGMTRFDVFAVFDTEAEVRALAPDMAALTALGSRGVIVTARADEGKPYEVVSRLFAPGCGIPEDPVTGSAHCAIGPYWADRLGTDEVACFQASRRGGHVGVRIVGDRVELTGRATTVLHGELTV